MCERNPTLSLGASSANVQRILGVPNFSFSESENEKRTDSTFLTHGIVGTFENDQLIRIAIPGGTQESDSQEGFLPYPGVIVRGLRITDDKDTILRTMGKPTKIESDGLPKGTDAEVPVVWPKGSRYYWRLPECVVEVDFLDQAQLLDEEKHLTLPNDSVIGFQIMK